MDSDNHWNVILIVIITTGQLFFIQKTKAKLLLLVAKVNSLKNILKLLDFHMRAIITV